MPGFGHSFGGGLRSNKKTTTTSTEAAITFSGPITVANGSSARTITVSITLFKTSIPKVGWFITFGNNANHIPITVVSTSGANYVLTYAAGTAFTGGLGNTVTISNH